MIGTGTGALSVMEEVNREAHRRKIKLQILPTAEAIKALEKHPEMTKRDSASDMLEREPAGLLGTATEP